MPHKIVVIGLGLIGGSLALELKKKSNTHIVGIDTPEHSQQALELGIVDQIGSMDDVENCDVVIIAVPIDVAPIFVSEVLDNIAEKTLVFDVGSTKSGIAKLLKNHSKRKNFVAAHPIAGTEFSGPKAAFLGLFDEKVMIICDKNLSDPKILETALKLFENLNMRVIFMNSHEHDKHIAYVSHLSHISSFMLGKTVLEIEKDEKNIFDMAGSGFESTVRLAKSSPEMWSPIFIQNKENIVKSLDEYIKNLIGFKELILNEDKEQLKQIMYSTNHIKEVLE